MGKAFQLLPKETTGFHSNTFAPLGTTNVLSMQAIFTECFLGIRFCAGQRDKDELSSWMLRYSGRLPPRLQPDRVMAKVEMDLVVMVQASIPGG